MSRLIKSQWANPPGDNVKVIGIKKVHKVDGELEPDSGRNQAFLEQIHQERDAIITKATEEANALVQKAKDEIHQLSEQLTMEKQSFESFRQEELQLAKKEGYEIGLEEGRHTAQMEYSSLLELAQEVVSKSEEQVQFHIERAEQTILHLAVEVAENILKDTLVQQPESFLPLVKYAVKQGKEQKKLQLHVSLQMYPMVTAGKTELDQLLPPDAILTIYPNDELVETQCYIHTSAGKIDASVDTQLIEVKSKLMSLLQEEK